MINSENVLNSTQLEEAIQKFVHTFCLEKHDIHSPKSNMAYRRRTGRKNQANRNPERRTPCR